MKPRFGRDAPLGGPPGPGPDATVGPAFPVIDARYRIIGVLGQGGFSRVYRAHAEHLARVVAVKVVTAVPDDEVLRRFYKEADRTAQLAHHPRIVRLLDHGLTETGQPFLTTELYEHGSVADQIAARGPCTVQDTLRVGVELCGALETVHRHRIFHRDVKPQNVLLDQYGDPALADFGVATLNRAVAAGSATASGFTPPHAPPEVWENKPATAATDTYSLGSTLDEFLRGAPAFAGGPDASMVAVMVQVLHSPVPPLERPDVPPELRHALDRAMAKEPGARFPTAQSFGEHLQAVQHHLGLPVTEMRIGAPTGVAPWSRQPAGPPAGPGARSASVDTLTSHELHEAQAGFTGGGASGPSSAAPPGLPPTNAVPGPLGPPGLAGREPRRARWRGPALVAASVLFLLGLAATVALVRSEGTPTAAASSSATTVGAGPGPVPASEPVPSVAEGSCRPPQQTPVSAPPGVPRITSTEVVEGDPSQVQVRWAFDGDEPVGEFYTVRWCDPLTGEVEQDGVLVDGGARTARVPAPPVGDARCVFVVMTYLADPDQSIRSAPTCL